MSRCKIELNRPGVLALLKSPEVAAACEQQAKEVAARLGNAYKTDVYQGRTRANASVYTDDPAEIANNLKNNTTLKALK